MALYLREGLGFRVWVWGLGFGVWGLGAVDSIVCFGGLQGAWRSLGRLKILLSSNIGAYMLRTVRGYIIAYMDYNGVLLLINYSHPSIGL